MVLRTLLFLQVVASPVIVTCQSGNEIRDGPAPSIIGSIDNVFESVKNYDSNRCIERMICEYMMPKKDDINTLSSRPIRGGVPFGPLPQSDQFPSPNSNFGPSFAAQGQVNNLQQFPTPGIPPQQFEGQFPPQQFGGQFPPQQFGGQFPPQQFGGQFPPQQPPFGPPQQFGNQFSSPPQQEGLLGLLSSLVGKKRRRRKRQTNLQGNILRLLKATGLDSMNAFPYIRAGLIGQASNPLERGGNSCSRMYRECPTEPDRLLSYFNNHNGGIINNVQPSVDNEIGPIVSAIISDLTEQNGVGTASGGNNGLLASAGSFLASYLSGSNSGGTPSTGGGLLSSLTGGSGNSGLLGSFLQSESGILNGAVNAITDYIHGPGPNGKK